MIGTLLSVPSKNERIAENVCSDYELSLFFIKQGSDSHAQLDNPEIDRDTIKISNELLTFCIRCSNTEGCILWTEKQNTNLSQTFSGSERFEQAIVNSK